MIPILFEKNETTFTTNGLGRLSETIRFIVTEERNGIYEAEFDYPVSGKMFGEIQIGRIVVCTHDEEGDLQPFDIYKVSEPIDGVVTFYATHISYRLNEITVEPFTASTCALAIAGLKDNSIGTNPFTFNTDKSVSAPYEVTVPTSLRGLLGGQENSILDVYGTGEYDWDKFSVYLYVARGQDTDVSIRYGKNLVDYTNETDYSATYNAVAPYWLGEVFDDEEGDSTQTLVTLPEKYISSGNTLPSGRTVIVPMDCSGDFETQPTEAELRTLATSKLANTYGWMPSQNITVNFVQLWQTEEYKEFAPLQKVKLCDTVLVNVPMYGVTDLRIKVIKVVWNVLLERYDEMELGNPQTTLAQAITDSTNVEAQIQAVKRQVASTTVISGNNNQHFWFTEAGTDTGAHITEIEREEFLDDPANGGGNLLARSNGIAVRDGLTEIATFGAASRVGRTSSSNVVIRDSGFAVFDRNGSSPFNVGVGDSPETGTITKQVIVDPGVTKTIPLVINSTAASTITASFFYYMRETVNLTIPTVIGTSTTETEAYVTFVLTLVDIGFYTLAITNGLGTQQYIDIVFTSTYYPADVMLNDSYMNVQTYVDDEGSPSQGSIIQYSSVGELYRAEITTFGKIAFGQFELTTDGPVAPGSDVLQGYIHEKWAPASGLAGLTDYFGGRAVIGVLRYDGFMVGRNCGTTNIDTGENYHILLKGTWIMK